MQGLINVAAREALTAMNANAALRAQAGGRLSTGLRVASALDGPAAFFTASRANGRAARLGAVLDGVAQAQRSLEAADAANVATGRLLDEMERLVSTAGGGAKGGAVTVGATTAEAGVSVLLKTDGLTASTDLRGLPGLDADANIYLYAFAKGGAAAVHDIGRDGHTVGDLMNTINASGNGVTAALNAGRLELTAAPGVEIGLRAATFGRRPGLEGTIYRGAHGNSLTGANAVVANAATSRVAGFQASSTDFPKGGSLSAETSLGAILGADAATLDDASVASQNNENTIIELTGTIQIAADGAYSFSTRSDDGIRVEIGSAVFGTSGWKQTTTQTVNLTAGEHRIRVLAWGGSGPNGFYLDGNAETGAGNARVTLDQDVLFTKTTDLDTTLPGGIDDATAERLEGLRTRILELAPDAHYGRTNAAMDRAGGVLLNERSTRYAPALQAIDADGLGLGSLESRDFKNAATISDALETARGRLAVHAGQIGTAKAVYGVREAFNRETQSVLRAGADALTLADVNAEGARLLAADTRSALAASALSLAMTQDRTALRLFG